MPFVQIHTERRAPQASRRALGAAVAGAYAAAMQTSSRIVNVAFAIAEPGDVARYDGDDDAAREMVIVTCDVRAGRTPAMHAELGAALTAACVEHLGIDAARVAVYLRELPAHAIYRDGGVAPAWSAQEAAKPAAPGAGR